MTHPHRKYAFRLSSAATLIIAMVSSGCGQKAYEEQLQHSRQFYEYLQTVEDNLSSPPWIRGDLGLSMRLPKPFGAPMPGPEKHKDQDGEMTEGPDPRQKNSLGSPLPGLVEAWEAVIDSPDGQPDAWIYMLTNQSRFRDADKGNEPPAEFLVDLENELMRIFQVTIPEGETSKVGDNARFRQMIPAAKTDRAQYTTPKDYTIVRFVPDAEFNSADLQATVCQRRVGELQVAVVVLSRKSTTALFRQRIEMALETLEIEPFNPVKARVPGAATPSSRGGQSRSSGSSGF